MRAERSGMNKDCDDGARAAQFPQLEWIGSLHTRPSEVACDGRQIDALIGEVSEQYNPASIAHI